MADGLFDPIGARPEARRGPRRLTAPLIVGGVLAVAAGGLFAAAALHDDGSGGEPRAVTTIERAKPAEPPVHAAPAAPLSFAAPGGAESAPDPAPPSQQATGDQDVEIQNGVRIVRPHRIVVPPGGPAARP